MNNILCFDITDDLTITGPGSANLTIDAGGTSRIFQIADQTDVTMTGLTLTGGYAVVHVTGSEAHELLKRGGVVDLAADLTIAEVTAPTQAFDGTSIEAKTVIQSAARVRHFVNSLTARKIDPRTNAMPRRFSGDQTARASTCEPE